MPQLQFKTNIQCTGCLSTVTPFLDEDSRISQWEVDLTHPNRVLSVTSENMSTQEVIATVAKAGFTAEPIS